MWSKVRQLTGRSKSPATACQNSNITADSLNDHYAAISNDFNYEPPDVKATVNHRELESCVTEWQIFKILDALKQTAMGLDRIPAWFLKIGAPFLVKPLTDMFNLSLSTSVVPRQWKTASILPIPKSNHPLQPADYRPISITPVLSRILERIVVKDFSLHLPITQGARNWFMFH